MEFKIAPNKDYGLCHKVGSIDLEYGVKGPELERELRKAQDTFVRSMELQGMVLYKHSGLDNPVWTTNEDGSPLAVYAIDWEGTRNKRVGADGNPLPALRATSLEETDGMVEYRIVGIFWSPKRSMEILRSRLDILNEERQSRHPTVFGVGGPPAGSQT